MIDTKNKLKYLSVMLIVCYLIVSAFFVFNLINFPKQYAESEVDSVTVIERELKSALDGDREQLGDRLNKMAKKYPLDIMIVQDNKTIFTSVPFDEPEYFSGSTHRDALLLETQGFYNTSQGDVVVYLKVYHAIGPDNFSAFIRSQTIVLLTYFLLLTLILTLMLTHILKPLELLKKSIKLIDQYDFDSIQDGSDDLTQGISDLSQKLKGTMNAVTRQHTELEKELQVRSERLDNVITVSRSFIHDLKTPVHQLLLENEEYVENIESPSSETLTLARINEKRVDTLISRINEILKMMNRSVYEEEQEKKVVNVVDVVKEVLNTFKKEFVNRGLTVELEIDEEIYLNVNLIYLKLLIHNLVSNMVQYAITGTTIKISVYEEDKYVYLETQNSGLPEDLNRMNMSENVLNALSDREHKSNKYSGGNGLFLIKDLTSLMYGDYTTRFTDDTVIITISLPRGDINEA